MTPKRVSGGPPSEPTSEPASPLGLPGPILGLMLRSTAVGALVASFLSTWLVPGLRGTAAADVVTVVEDISYATSACVWVLLVFAIWLGLVVIHRTPALRGALTWFLTVGASAVMLFALFALRGRLPVPFSFALAITTTAVAFLGAMVGLGKPQTRAASMVLVFLGLTAMARLVTWHLANLAGETANPQYLLMARSVATVQVLVESGAQLLAATWLGTRTRLTGQFVLAGGILGAFVVTWLATSPGATELPFWQSVLHSTFVHLAPVPAPFALESLAMFLIPASGFLSLVAAMQSPHVGAILWALAMALMARGGYDVPFRALSLTAGVMWLVLSTQPHLFVAWEDEASSEEDSSA